jgi:hypothetical protein
MHYVPPKHQAQLSAYSFDTEYGDSAFLRNVRQLVPDYVTSHGSTFRAVTSFSVRLLVHREGCRLRVIILNVSL